ncbi:polysaccharide deacetylase family protein [Tessaracoccus massiliensis]|uniref:polysaccharide deacetylase family protein n=1 Tax=Tessaracoccus massiliensis TaxID=1522311 RepID=UPI00058BB9FD|nr:polysaccharide deacetylase family protein [Tessaracoccus massiliensis]
MTLDADWPQMPGALVVARFARVHGDGSDADDRPDWIAPVGAELTFTPSITGPLVYDPTGAKIIVDVSSFRAVVGEAGFAVAKDGGHPIRLAPTDDPLMTRTGWLWTCSWSGGKVSFPAPSESEVNLADFIIAPPGNPVVEEWVARVTESIEVSGDLLQAAADLQATIDATGNTAADAASTAADSASAAATSATAAAESAATATSAATSAVEQLRELAGNFARVVHTGQSLIRNANWSDGLNHWAGINATLSSADGVLSSTASGAASSHSAYQSFGSSFTGEKGHRYWVSVEAELSDADNTTGINVSLIRGSSSVGLRGYNSSGRTLHQPEAGRWYVLHGVIVADASLDGANVQLSVAAAHASAADAAGRVLRIRRPMVIDITAAYGAGNEPVGTDVYRTVLEAHGGFLHGEERLSAPAAVATLDVRERRRPVQRALRGQHPGPMVVYRFDDGYQGCLRIAAPIMAKYGHRGTGYVGTGPEWLGSIRNSLPILTAGELVALHEDYGWEIASHTREHVAANWQPLPIWSQLVKPSITDISDMGLPVPRSFAYPNGTRYPKYDAWLYQNFRFVGVTVETANQMPWDKPAFMTGWMTINSSTQLIDAHFARMQRYVRTCFERGQHAVVAFHGITEGSATPPLHFHLQEAVFRRVVEWIDAEGYPVGTQDQMRVHNQIADPSFGEHPVGDAPWQWTHAGGEGWGRFVRRDDAVSNYAVSVGGRPAAGRGFYQHMHLTETGPWKLYINAHIPTRTAGSVVVDIDYQNDVGDVLSSEEGVITLDAPTSGPTLRAGTFTAPAHATTARVTVRTHPTTSFTGVVHVGFVGAFPAHWTDPLAIAL